MNGFILSINEPNEVLEKFKILRNCVSELHVVIGNESMLNTNQFQQKGARLLYGRDLRPGEVFCSLGHRFIYEKAKAFNNWTLVLEDDAIIDKCFEEFLKLSKNWELESPTIVLLGHSKTLKRNLWFQNIKQPIYNICRLGKFTLGEKNVDLVGTVGYLINKEAARLISENNLLFWKADHWSLYTNLGIKLLHLKHPIVWEDFQGRESSTMNSNKIHHNLFSNRFFIELGSAILSQVRRICSIRKNYANN